MRNKVLIFTAVLILLFGNAVNASVKEVDVDELQPTREQRQAVLLITRVIDKYHYKKQRLDDVMSSSIFDRYLEALDPNKSYLTQQDIRTFEIYKRQLDDALRQARLEPAFNIFKVFRQRLDERMDYALKLVEQDFDFTVDEEYRFDRTEAPWAASSKALDELWRKRVKNDVLNLRLGKKPKEKIRDTLRKRYQDIKRRTHQLASQDVFQSFMNAYTLSLEPHTSYMSPRVSENFDINMRLSLEGIGAVLRNEDEYTIIVRTVAGGPAEMSGKVKAGDRIIGVAQGKDGEMEDVIGWRLQDVVDKVRGPKDSVIRLKILPESEGDAGQANEISLVRNKIKLEDMAAKSSIIEGIDQMGPVRIGVIDLPAFYRDFRGHTNGDEDFRSTTRDVRKLLKELTDQGVDGIILDLRENGGGSLIEATELTGLFIPTGPVVQVKNAGGGLEVERDPDPELVYGGPLAVLVDRNSASASEIFAGAIQDYKRGIIVGEPTFGKGTVQTLVDLGRFVRTGGDKLGRLRLTMAQFFRVKGGSTQFKGVIPDIDFPSASGAEEHGERGLDNALPWAKIPAASFSPAGIGSLDKYVERHRKRIKGDPGFEFLAAEDALLKEARGKKVVSLMESRRKQESDERDARRKQRKNSFLTAMGLEPESDDDDEADHSTPDDDKDDPVEKIMLHETARILSDYIEGQRRAAMVH
ncbi:MAG: carboxy terminal-processing peptidase [Candidatus Sedimenticola sp. 20ELBAFRAG]